MDIESIVAELARQACAEQHYERWPAAVAHFCAAADGLMGLESIWISLGDGECGGLILWVVHSLHSYPERHSLEWTVLELAERIMAEHDLCFTAISVEQEANGCIEGLVNGITCLWEQASSQELL